MMKPFIIIGVAFFLVVFFVKSNQEEVKTTTIVSVVDKETGKNLSGSSLTIIPDRDLDTDAKLAGKGNYIYKISMPMPALIIADAKGYKKKVAIVWIKPDGEKDIALTKDKTEKTTTSKKEEKKEEPKEKEKLQLDFYKK